MNEFVEQFLIEARELVAQATDDLLALEARADGERLHSAFRAFHTLKGAAGIVDFDAMGRALHVAEDVLARARAAGAALPPKLIGDLLTCLDRVSQWLDQTEVSGDPPSNADAEADGLIRLLQHSELSQASPPAEREEDWPAALLANNGDVSAKALVAVRVVPDADCFFRGEDPLAAVATIPGILALDLEPRTAWPPLASLDPFECRLTISALTAGSVEEARTALHGLGGKISVLRLRDTGELQADDGLSAVARAVLQEQIAVLAVEDPDGIAGRYDAAARVVRNVLLSSGMSAQAARLNTLSEGFSANAARSLAAAIGEILGGQHQSEIADEPLSPKEPPSELISQSLRVDVARIDAAVQLAGELTVLKNALGHAAHLAQQGAEPQLIAGLLKDQHAQFDRMVGALQRSLLAIRVMPLNHVFRRFPRLVRDMTATLGKPARLIINGETTEADKAIVEALFEPLMHVLRNAVDHGVEAADQRSALGKDPVATITMSAARDGDHVVIEVADDGKGIDPARVRKVAAVRDVATAEQLAVMSDGDLIDLIFAPGFSTAAAVTSLSGRGVGMDAVRTTIDRLGGRVGIESQVGLGTTVRLILPFTVMMTTIMTVEVCGQMFGLPLEGVAETVRVARQQIVPIGGAQALVLRDVTIPIVHLASALERSSDTPLSDEATIVIISVAGQLGGIEVDRLGAKMDVMLKPVGGILAGMPGVAGTTLLGDGRVLLVLDIEEWI